MGAKMKISKKGLALIKHFEGLVLEAYLDPVGIWTIGYGHTKTAEKGMKITEPEAEALLLEDLEGFEKNVNKKIKVKLNSDEFSALCSFAFNVGNGAFGSSTLLKVLNKGDRKEAAKQFKRWVKGTIGGKKVTLPGLVRRRDSESLLFSTGVLDFGNGPVTLKSDVFDKKAAKPAAADIVVPTSNEARFMQLFQTWGIKHFGAHELLVKGYRHSDSESPAFGLNTHPPENTWENIFPTVKVLDILRSQLGSPIMTTSVYRSPAYNAAIGGAQQSLHMEFNAIDFIVKHTTLSPAQWGARLNELKADGVFDGFVGVYDHFVHLDTRGNI